MPCPEPFIDELSVLSPGGYLDGRWCKSIGNASCCFPCPMTDWIYSEHFNSDLGISFSLGLGVFVLAVALSVSYLVLPKQVTWRHYLNTAPLIGFIFMSAAYCLPLATKPKQCHDSITPNDWKSDVSCAFTGSFLCFGVWVIVISCFFRTLSLYLHLRWEKELGKIFMVSSLTVIFAGAAGLLVIALTLSGVSYQIGSICVIDVYNGKTTFWGPLLAIGTLTLVLQVLLMGHCLRVVLRPLDMRSMLLLLLYRHKRTSVVSQQTVMTYTTHDTNHTNQSSSTATARQASTRVWRVLQLQWRAILTVFLILLHMAFLTQMFFRIHPASHYSLDELMPWIRCLMASSGANKEKCLSYGSQFGPSENNVVAAMCLLIASGFWGFVCVMRLSIITGWIDLFKEKKVAVMDSTKISKFQDNDIEEARSNDSYSTDAKEAPSTKDSDWTYHEEFADLDKCEQLVHKERNISRNYQIPKLSFSAPTSPLNSMSI